MCCNVRKQSQIRMPCKQIIMRPFFQKFGKHWKRREHSIFVSNWRSQRTFPHIERNQSDIHCHHSSSSWKKVIFAVINHIWPRCYIIWRSDSFSMWSNIQSSIFCRCQLLSESRNHPRCPCVRVKKCHLSFTNVTNVTNVTNECHQCHLRPICHLDHLLDLCQLCHLCHPIHLTMIF